MAVGLRIRNQDTSQIQIGNGYRNLELIKSGTLNTNSFIGGGDITYTRSPVGLLSSTLGNDYMHVIRYVNDTIAPRNNASAWQVSNSFQVGVASNSDNKTVEYYTFGYSSNQPSGPVGLRLRNEDGTTLYDSRKKSLRVLATISITAAIGPTNLLLGQYFPGTKIGICMPSPRFFYNAPNPEKCDMTSDGYQLTSDNRIYLGPGMSWSQNLGSSSRFPVGNTYFGNSTTVMLVVDLTEVPLNFTA
jgi:hypothetical protein